MASKDQTSNYNSSLLPNLVLLCINSSEDFTDFVIQCANNDSQDQQKTELHTHRLLLVVRSKYFEALIRQEPKTTQANLDFEGKDVKIILDNLIEISEDLAKLDVVQILKLLEITDFLQMEGLTQVFEDQIAIQMTKENIHDIINFTENLHLPNTHARCNSFVKENIAELDLKLFSRTWLKQLTSLPFVNAIDKYGRVLSMNVSETLLVAALAAVDLKEDWNISLLTKRRMHMTLSSISTNLISEETKKKLLLRYPLKRGENLKTCPNYPELLLGDCSIQTYFSDGVFGRTPLGLYLPEKPKTQYIKGNFRRVGVKIRHWENKIIIQGLRIELDTGIVKALGMDVDDTRNVTELVVPEGQHIKEFHVNIGSHGTGMHLNSISFVTNKGLKFGPVGINGLNYRPQLIERQTVPKRLVNDTESLAYYCNGLCCNIVNFASVENDPNPQTYLANVRFCYVRIPKSSLQVQKAIDFVPKSVLRYEDGNYHEG